MAARKITNIPIMKYDIIYYTSETLTDHFSYDFRALWRSGLSARVPENQKIKMVGLPAWHRIP